MGFADRLLSGIGASQRSTFKVPSSSLVSALSGTLSYSGKTVSVEDALGLVSVWGASSLVAGAVGGVPLKVFNSKKEEARGSRQWRLLHDEPNDEQAADELWELVAHQLLLWGNSFLFKERDEFGLVQQLWPIHPSRVMVGRENRPDGRAYKYFVIDGNQKRKYYEADVLHVRGLGSDGLIGYSVVDLARQSLGSMLAQQEFSGTFWKDGSFMGAALTHPGEMSEPAQERLTKQLEKKRGVSKTGQIWVFEEDMKLQMLGMPLKDAQFVEQAKLSKQEVAEMFGLVPPHRWGTDSSSMTYANAELAGTEFVRWTGRKWWTRIEKAFGRDRGLFPQAGPSLYPQFVPDDLMRADTKSRYETYQIAIEAGIMSRNEVRDRENLQPVPGGDEIVVQQAQAPAAPADQPVQ